MRVIARFALIACLAMVMPAQASKLPVGDFFKDPEFSSVSLSPTGEYIMVSVPREDRTLLAAFRVSDMKLVGKWDYGSNFHAERVRWVNDKRFFAYVTRKLGRYDFRVGTPDLHVSDVDGKNRTVIPNGGGYRIVDTLDDDPETILVERSIDASYLFKMKVKDGTTRTIASAPLSFGSFVVDHEGAVRYAFGVDRNQDRLTLRRDGENWTEIHRTKMGEAERIPYGFDKDNRRVYMVASEAGEPGKLYLLDPETGEQELLAGNANVSIDGALSSSDRRGFVAVSFMDGLPATEFIDKAHPEAKTYAALINAFPNHAVDFNGISRSGRHVLVRAYSDIDPGSYYLFDRQTNQAKFLLAARSWIKPEQMSPMRPIKLVARDGTPLHGYITIPRNSAGKNLPMILHPHGGPHGPRDEWGFNPEVQFLASRGYAVLQVNFRGSGGYGQAFERKGYRNWGTAMVDDMTDAVEWTIKQGIADRNRVCTYGASYGGYAALQSVVREPSRYRCTIGYVGLYNMDLWMKDSDVAESESGRAYQRRVFPESASDRQAQSAGFNVDKINVPVMLVHGARDMRVPISQYHFLKKNLEAAGKPPEVAIVEEKEGHGFYDYQNQVDLYTAMEAFLEKHIGDKRSSAQN